MLQEVASIFQTLWNDHMDNITAKAGKCLYLSKELRRAGVSCNDLVLFYCSAIRSVLKYSSKPSSILV